MKSRWFTYWNSRFSYARIPKGMVNASWTLKNTYKHSKLMSYGIQQNKSQLGSPLGALPCKTWLSKLTYFHKVILGTFSRVGHDDSKLRYQKCIKPIIILISKTRLERDLYDWFKPGIWIHLINYQWNWYGIYIRMGKPGNEGPIKSKIGGEDVWAILWFSVAYTPSWLRSISTYSTYTPLLFLLGLPWLPRAISWWFWTLEHV